METAWKKVGTWQFDDRSLAAYHRLTASNQVNKKNERRSLLKDYKPQSEEEAGRQAGGRTILCS